MLLVHCAIYTTGLTDPSHKSQDALDKYPTMHHTTIQNVALYDICLMQCGI